MSNRTPPLCLALIVCDAVWRDSGTGKCTILGTFSNIFADKFPVAHPILAVYFALTDGRGEYDLTLQLVDVDDERDPLFVLHTKMDLYDPRVVGEGFVHVSQVTFPDPGEYRLQILTGQDLLMERRILAVSAESIADSLENQQ